MRLRVFRDEVQDVVPLDFDLLFAAARRRDVEDGREAPGETESCGGVDVGNGD
ncbi:hypothetical protein [Actinoplanes sp. G11-F43]|uniref:hypothetical protein n=1 Tax=Actinoplanes sp. G11-F43 TaxID=3424130 RepID=UPI003D35039C